MLGRELEVSLDVMMYYLSIRTVLKLFARDWLLRIIWPDVISTRYLYYRSGITVNCLLVDYSLLVILFGCMTFQGNRVKKAKLECPWEVHYVVISVLLGVACRIQKSRKAAKPKFVHLDRLKPYLGPPLERWIPKWQTQLSSPRQEGRETSDVDSSVCRRRLSVQVVEREGVKRLDQI